MLWGGLRGQRVTMQLRKGSNKFTVSQSSSLGLRELRRKDDIVAIKDGEHIWGFHARNLQVAELDQSAWLSMHFQGSEQASSQTSGSLKEAREELKKWNDEIDPTVQNDSQTHEIRSLVVNITQICNLRCVYCAAGGDGSYGSDVTKVNVEKVYRQLDYFLPKTRKNEIFSINFFGGEPLIHPDAIKSIAEYARKIAKDKNIELRFSITTNGTLITDRVANLLADLNCHVTISLDGPQMLNDLFRPTAGGKGSTSKTLKGIENLKTVRQKLSSIGVNCVFGSHNMDIVSAYKFFQELDLDFINPIYATNNQDDIYSDLYIEQMEKVLKLAYEHNGEKELLKFTPVHHYFSTMDDGVRTNNHCGAGKSLLFTDTQGDLYSCNWFMTTPQEKIGELIDFNSKREEYLNPLIEKNNCNSCWARFLCGGGCMFVNLSKNGSKDSKDPYFCKRTRSLVTMSLKYYARLRTEQQIATKGVAI